MGGRGGVSRLVHGVSPRAAVAFESAWTRAGDPPAVLIPSVAARATNTGATAFPRARPAAMSLAVALPERSAASRCSAALRVISSTEVGKSSFRSSAVTPEITASSEG
jgi:hypothetical protein